MLLLPAVAVLLPVWFSAFCPGGGFGSALQHPVSEWDDVKEVVEKEETELIPMVVSEATARDGGHGGQRLPVYVRVKASQDPKLLFSPALGSRPLPPAAKEVLFRSVSSVSAGQPSMPKLVEMMCHFDKMYVRIRTDVFSTRQAYKYLKLGWCPVNRGNSQYYYFQYSLDANCGFKKQSHPDYFTVSSVLRYDPWVSGPVVRELPFTIPLQCNFHRLFHSYKVGFHPKLQGGTVYKSLTPKTTFVLVPQDASGTEVTGPKVYTLGEAMCFVAKLSDAASHNSGHQRLYINTCFMTASQSPESSPKYTVIDNEGCMTDGKVTEKSKFLRSASMLVQEFCVAAFMFSSIVSSTTSSQQMYMHCEMTLKEVTPSASAKACNYDPVKKWQEVHGDDSVCTCCDSSCPSAQQRASRETVSSPSWKVAFKDKRVTSDPLKPALGSKDPDVAKVLRS
ncbi:zona pellucida sperm-binding protein 3 [Thalassophryne amazonica]|uniref:zona pellucida sperm-binding protein 3 n=1 Tax=Thalassophryne amazonica TaxID=390379 RepID=UPI001470CF1A|nr:zona pellucida sperm-binding protein 3 [Thalassophryne amazonica]